MENDICKVWDMSMDEVGAPRRVAAAVLLLLSAFSRNPVPKRLGKGLNVLGQLSDAGGVAACLVWLAAFCGSLNRAGVVNWSEAASSHVLRQQVLCVCSLSPALDEKQVLILHPICRALCCWLRIQSRAIWECKGNSLVCLSHPPGVLQVTQCLGSAGGNGAIFTPAGFLYYLQVSN